MLQPSPLKQNLVSRFEGEKVLKGQRTITPSLTTAVQNLDGENGENSHFPMLLILHYGCSIVSWRSWSSCALWHDSFDPRSWSGARYMLNLPRAVPLLIIQHSQMHSSTSLAMIHGRCHGLLPTTVVNPACTPRFHTSQGLGMVQCNEVIASLSL
jgi:hypothetical protein